MLLLARSAQIHKRAPDSVGRRRGDTLPRTKPTRQLDRLPSLNQLYSYPEPDDKEHRRKTPKKKVCKGSKLNKHLRNASLGSNKQSYKDRFIWGRVNNKTCFDLRRNRNRGSSEGMTPVTKKADKKTHAKDGRYSTARSHSPAVRRANRSSPNILKSGSAPAPNPSTGSPKLGTRRGTSSKQSTRGLRRSVDSLKDGTRSLELRRSVDSLKDGARRGDITKTSGARTRGMSEEGRRVMSAAELEEERARARRRIAERRKKTMKEINKTEKKDLEAKRKYKAREAARRREEEEKRIRRAKIYYHNALKKKLYEIEFSDYMADLEARKSKQALKIAKLSFIASSNT
mmetsp:Transcript_21689/g.40630  ORF Transcript_21689/g.40630 Transcript_21689/m.40630 type:complete len:344 (-) Transcript_21689:244-1275(-)